MQKQDTPAGKNRQELWELVRYVVAGALTTVIALIVSYGYYFLVSVGQAADAPVLSEGLGPFVSWVVDVINIAGPTHVAVGNVIAWIVAVIFAFWINRWMVFRVQYHNQRDRFKAFLQFVSARVISLLLFEVGLAALLSAMGTQNLIGRIIVLILVMIFNYVASKFWIFKKPANVD